MFLQFYKTFGYPLDYEWYLSIFDLSACGSTNVGIMNTIWMLVHTLRNKYESGKDADLPYIIGVAEKGFTAQLSLIRNASLITNLTSAQNVCVRTAARDADRAIHEGKRGFL